MRTWRILASNTLAQLAGKVATAGSTLLVTRLVADTHGLGRDGYGAFSIVTAYAAYFYILTDFGLNAVAVKRVTEDESRLAEYVAKLLSLRLVIAAGLIVVGLIGLAFLPYSPLLKVGCMVMLLAIVAQAVVANSNIVFQAKLRYGQSVMANVAGSLVTLALVFLSYKAGAGLLVYIIDMVIGYAVMAGLSIILAGSYAPVRLIIDLTAWRQIAAEALPLGLTMAFNLAYFKADAFLMSFVPLAPSLHLTNEAAVGLYGMAYKVFEVALTIPVFFVNALYPMLVRARQEDQDRFRRLVGWSISGSIGVSIIGSALMILLAPWLIMIVSSANPAFKPSVGVLQILALSLPLFFLTNILLWLVMTMGKQRVLAFLYAIAAVVNVGLNAWLIPRYGYVAAAMTTGLTELLTLLLLSGVVWPLLRGGYGGNGQEASLDQAVEVTT